MLPFALQVLILNSYVPYGLGFLIATILISILKYVSVELRAKRKCKQQNLKYVNVPSQAVKTALRQRYDIIEDELVEKHGTIFGCHMMNNFTIICANAEIAQIALNREFTKLADRRSFESKDPVFDSILFSANGEQWKRIRAVLSPTFSAGKLRKIKFCIDDTVKTMIDNLNQKLGNERSSVFDIKSIVGAFTIDTIIQMGFGVKMDSLNDPNNLMIKNVKRVFSVNISMNDLLFFFLAAVYPPAIGWLGLKFQPESMAYFKGVAMKIIEEKRKELKSKPDSYKASNFIELLLEVEQEQIDAQSKQNGNGQALPFKHMNIDEILAQCVTLFLVGYDSTATTMTNCLYQLAKNPEKQEKLYQDIKETINKLSKERNTTNPHELIDLDTLNQFEYLGACVNETTRLMTLATATERCATQDFRIETSDKKIWFDIKKDDVLRIPIQTIHHSEDYFDEPHQFKPERFLPNYPGLFNKQAFLPFGTGPRNCLAKMLALLEIKMCIIHLIRSYQFHVDKRTEKTIPFTVQLDLLMTKQLHLRVEKRS